MKKLSKELKEIKVLLRSVPPLMLALFILSVVLMNLLANKSIDTGSWTWLALDSGIVISWLSFLTMDMMVKRFGPKAATSISIVAIVINLGVSLVFMVVSMIPGFWGESYVEVGGDLINRALNNTISGTWYILLGSTIAFLASSVLNNILNHIIGKLLKKHSGTFLEYSMRSYLSTMIAQFADNLIFAFIVSYNFFGWSIIQCISCAATGALVELVCEIIFSPIGYRVVRKWEKNGVGNEYLNLIK